MNSLMRIVAIALLPMSAASFSAVGEEAAPPRIAWQGGLDSKKAVKWIYEGCAAYPVTEEEASTASLDDRPAHHSKASITVGLSDKAK
jgi:hypothetical protein